MVGSFQVKGTIGLIDTCADTLTAGKLTKKRGDGPQRDTPNPAWRLHIGSFRQVRFMTYSRQKTLSEIAMKE